MYMYIFLKVKNRLDDDDAKFPHKTVQVYRKYENNSSIS